MAAFMRARLASQGPCASELFSQAMCLRASPGCLQTPLNLAADRKNTRATQLMIAAAPSPRESVWAGMAATASL